MNTQTVTINLVPGLSTPPVVNVKQGDIGRPIAFRVMDGTGLMTAIAGATAKIEGTKPSGLGFSVTGTISGNMVTLDTTEAMTQEAGRIPAEISFTKTGLVLGTANFILAVERDPHPENVIDGTYETMDDIQTQMNALDTRVTALEAGGGGSGLTDDVKTALLQIAQKVAYIDAHGQDYYDDLYDALYNDTTRSVLLVLSHVSSSNSQSTVEVGDSYTTTLTASTNYTLNSVSVTMGGVDITSTSYSSGTVSIPSVTGNITITATAVLAAQSITAVYTQSGTVYDTDTLDSLKPDLVVTANYSGGTSETVPASDYTLSGTLAVGTSTITVTYAGLTTTFSVTVSHMDNSIISWDFTQSLTDSKQGLVATLGGTATRDSSGLDISSASAYAVLGKFLAVDQSYEIDIADMDASSWTNTNGRLFIWYNSNGGGLVYNNNNSTWSIYRSAWYDPSTPIASREYFENSTVKITVTAGSTQYKKNVTVYKDGTEIISAEVNNDPVDSSQDVYLGSTATSAFSVTITGFRVYSEV
jgi:hypothetical protein